MKIKFGFARRCTTPQEPISLAGYFNRRVWNKILDDLEVRAVVFKDGKNCGAILQFDILSINSNVYDTVIKAVANAGLKDFTQENLLICATHTHTAPNTFNEPNSKDYCEFIALKAAEALKEAAKSLRSGELFTATAKDSRFIFNRRYWMKDGRVVTNPGKLNPDILRPEGDIDPEIPMLAFKTDAGLELLITSIVNHTDTIGGCGVSADWPGFLHRTIEAEMAPGAMLLPLIGTSGNINHFDTSTDMNQTNYGEPERIGKGYAESIRAALDSLVPVKGKGFSFNSMKVKSAPRELPAEDIAAALAVMNKYPDIDLEAKSQADITSEDLAKGTPYTQKYFANALLMLANNHRRPEFRICCLKFGGSTVLASLPSEPFVEIGLELRKGIFQNCHCLVSSHGNYNGGKGYAGGYIPNPWNYGRGGYEDTPRSSGYSTKTSELLLAAWRKLAKK